MKLCQQRRDEVRSKILAYVITINQRDVDKQWLEFLTRFKKDPGGIAKVIGVKETYIHQILPSLKYSFYMNRVIPRELAAAIIYLGCS